MTKETKIGLLVGVGMILFICILVSDMLSSDPDAAHAANRDPSAGGVDDAAGGGVDADAQRLLADLHRPLPEPNQRTSQTANPSGGPEDQTAAPDRPAQGIGGRSLSNTRPFEHDIIINNTDPEPTDADRQAEDGFVFHHVQRGQSPWSIAEQHYGDGEYYRLIYEHNRDKMPSPDTVREGVTLRIPKRHDAGHAQAGSASERSGEAASTRADQSPSAPAAVATVEHTVAPGETFSELAQRYYGTTKAMPKLLELNRDRIDDPDKLRVGQKLLVPVASRG